MRNILNILAVANGGAMGVTLSPYVNTAVNKHFIHA